MRERGGEERRGEIKSVLKLPERDLSCLRTCSGMAKSDCPDSRNCNYRHNQCSQRARPARLR